MVLSKLMLSDMEIFFLMEEVKMMLLSFNLEW